MDAPSTGWVTALAGLLARGSLPLVRPSRLPSGRSLDERLAAHSCGGSHGFPCKYGSVFPLSSPGWNPENQHAEMLACGFDGVKRAAQGQFSSHFFASARIKPATRLF